jgi:hypothetical protein
MVGTRYNHFLSPLAPTAGHPPYLVWGFAIRGLAALGIAIPEYVQYLTYTYVLAPVLAYTAFILLARRFCQTWIAASLALVCYALGGPGIWNGAWMFYQEWFCVFLLLLAYDVFVRQPSRRAFLLLGIATLIYAASLNYWTVFASWFVAFFIIAHSLIYRPTTAARWLVTFLRRPLPATLTALMVLICVAWVTTIGLVYVEQAHVHIRGNTESNSFSAEAALAKGMLARAFDLTQLFKPILEENPTPVHVSLGTSGLALCRCWRCSSFHQWAAATGCCCLSSFRPQWW